MKRNYSIKPTLLLLSLFVQMHIYAQFTNEEQQSKALANEYFSNQKYEQAARLYKKLLSKDSLQIEAAYKYALCKYYQLNYAKARTYFTYVQQIDTENQYPKSYFYYALSEKNLGEYKKAIAGFQKHLSLEQDIDFQNRAMNEIASCNFAIQHQNDSTNAVIEHLPSPINTEYSEFNPIPLNSSELVFSRYQNVFKDSFESIFSQSYISDIMISKQSENGYTTPGIYSKQLQGHHDFTANISFNRSRRKAYFTICNEQNGNVGSCAIYFSEYKNGKWKKPKRLNDEINMPGYSSTHPFIVEGKEFDILYFSSNRPGGFGGMDLWYVIIKNGKYQKVTNLGSIINTKGSEITPSYDKQHQSLYFSSDWHQGFGGFDIFRATGGLNSWTEPSNLGLPINSSSNDSYYYFKAATNEAWLSSNRVGSFYHGNAENCCNDIYYVNFEQINKKQTDSITETVVQLDKIEQKIQKLLPLTLYFHNDIPDPRSRKPTTNKDYKDLLADYFKLKEKYKKEYSKGLKGEQATKAKQDIENFFDNYVGHGFEDLEKLAALLKNELDNGKNIRLKIKGYASPLNTTEYNLNLSKRRIASLVNYLKNYDNGYFIPYFEGTASNGGSIQIFEDPLGDTQAAEFVSDNPNDKRNSIYSRAAAMERKIQIILYSSGNTIAEDIHNKEFPVLKIKTQKLTPDSIAFGERGVFTIDYENTGKSELVIKSVKSSATYISTVIKKPITQANSKGKILLLIQSENLERGSYQFDLEIYTNMLEGKIQKTYSFHVY